MIMLVQKRKFFMCRIVLKYDAIQCPIHNNIRLKRCEKCRYFAGIKGRSVLCKHITRHHRTNSFIYPKQVIEL